MCDPPRVGPARRVPEAGVVTGVAGPAVGDGLRVHILHPGDVVCVDRGETLLTLLGSCVCVILSDRARTVGAMSHIVFPDRPGRDPGGQPRGPRAGLSTSSARGAIETMCRHLRGRGFNPALCDAFVAGGANMFPQHFGDNHVGERNLRLTLEILRNLGARVSRTACGGTSYRYVRWVVGPHEPQVLEDRGWHGTGSL